MPITLKCINDDCNTVHTLQDDEYRVEDGRKVASIYKQRCPECRVAFDNAIEDIRRVERAQAEEYEQTKREYRKEQRRERRRERVEEMVADYGAPRALVPAILNLIDDAFEEERDDS